MMNLDELEAEALKLDLLARTELIRRLTASLSATPAASTPTADERERLWLQEAMRRSRELRDAPPSNPTVPPRAQAEIAFSPRATAAPRSTRKKSAARATRGKPAKRAKPPARSKRPKPPRRPAAKPKPRKRSRR